MLFSPVRVVTPHGPRRFHATPLAFLAAAHHLRLKGSSPLDIKHANAFWSVKLVGRQAHEINAQFSDI